MCQKCDPPSPPHHQPRKRKERQHSESSAGGDQDQIKHIRSASDVGDDDGVLDPRGRCRTETAADDVVSVAVLGYLNMDRIVLQGGW